MSNYLQIITELEMVTKIQAKAIRILAMGLAELGDTGTGRDEITKADEIYREAIGGTNWVG